MESERIRQCEETANAIFADMEKQYKAAIAEAQIYGTGFIKIGREGGYEHIPCKEVFEWSDEIRKNLPIK